MKTEREEFGEWWTHDFWGRKDVVENPSPEQDEYFAAISAWQAGRAPLLKRIEELEFAVKVLSDGIEGGTEK